MAASPWACCCAAPSRSMPLVGARDAAERKALFIAWAKFGVASVLVGLHHALWSRIDPGDIAHLRPRRGAGHDLRMEVARLPGPADAGADPAGGALCRSVARPETAVGAPADRDRPGASLPALRPQRRAAGDAGAARGGAGAGPAMAVAAGPISTRSGGSLLVQRMRALARPAGHAAMALCLAVARALCRRHDPLRRHRAAAVDDAVGGARLMPARPASRATCSTTTTTAAT